MIVAPMSGIDTASAPIVASAQATTSASVRGPQWCAQRSEAPRSATDRSPKAAATRLHPVAEEGVANASMGGSIFAADAHGLCAARYPSAQQQQLQRGL